MTQDAREKMKILLKHWAGHNQEHGEEFRAWAKSAFDMDEKVAHDAILEAAVQMDKANEFLLKALESLKPKES